MGNQSFKSATDVVLVPQTSALKAPNVALPAFPTTTYLHCQRLNGEFKVFDFSTGVQLLRVDHHCRPGKNEWVLDQALPLGNVPVVAMERERGTNNFFIKPLPARDGAGEQQPTVFFKIDSWTVNFYSQMRMKFSDPDSGDEVRLDVKGDWRLHKVVMRLSRKAHGARKFSKPEPICRVAFEDNGYNVEIATGVDVALMAMFVFILDGSVNDFPLYQGNGAGEWYLKPSFIKSKDKTGQHEHLENDVLVAKTNMH